MCMNNGCAMKTIEDVGSVAGDQMDEQKKVWPVFHVVINQPLKTLDALTDLLFGSFKAEGHVRKIRFSAHVAVDMVAHKRVMRGRW